MKGGGEYRTIGEVCDLATGGTPSRSKPEYFGGEIKWLVSGDIHNREIFDCEGRITSAGLENSNARILPVDSVMIALNGQGKTRGTVALLRTEATCNQSLVSISPKNRNKLLPEYLFHNLNGRYDEIRKMTGDDGNDRRGLNMPLIRSIELPLPPIEEQRRIVAILDEAFAAIDKAKANTEKNIQNARELFDSYLNNIFANPAPDWEVTPLKELAAEMTTGPFGSNLHKSDYVVDGIPVVNPQNIVSGEIVSLAKTMVNEETRRRLSKYILKENDIILARRGEMGRCGIVSANQAGWLCGSGSFLLRVNGRLDPKYARVFLSSATVRKYLLKGSVGATMDNLNQSILASLPVPVPTKMEQHRILSEFKVLKDRMVSLESVLRVKQTQFDELKKSILQKAITGEIR